MNAYLRDSMKSHDYIRRVILCITVILLAVSLQNGLASKDENLRTENRQRAETILLYQRNSGGWPKNYEREEKLLKKARSKVLSEKNKNDAMIDNGATHTEIRLLADAYEETSDNRFRDAAIKGITYLLTAQYDNGGWPQRFPKPEGYAKHITFNDNAMIGVMSLMRDILVDRKRFSFVQKELNAQCEKAIERGIRCILKCQIKVNGRRTVWCAQHDEKTFQPRKARSYELPSFSGNESVEVVRFLMQVDQPGKQVIEAIEGAVAWFEQSKLEGIKLVSIEDPTKPVGYDKIVVKDDSGSPMWARFYDIKTNDPIFCSRDGVPRKTLAEISHERRNGYSWLGYYATDLLAKDLPAWEERLGRR